MLTGRLTSHLADRNHYHFHRTQCVLHTAIKHSLRNMIIVCVFKFKVGRSRMKSDKVRCKEVPNTLLTGFDNRPGQRCRGCAGDECDSSVFPALCGVHRMITVWYSCQKTFKSKRSSLEDQRLLNLPSDTSLSKCLPHCPSAQIECPSSVLNTGLNLRTIILNYRNHLKMIARTYQVAYQILVQFRL